MTNKPYVVQESEIVWRCPWWSVRKDNLQSDDGSKGTYFYAIHHPSVVIVPVTSNKEVVMIYHYRYPLKEWCWEIPAGRIEEGQVPEDAVTCELLEEVGGRANKIDFVSSFFNTNGSSNEESKVFLATDVSLEEAQQDPMESMEIHLKSIDEALKMARTGKIKDGVSALALLMCEERLKEFK